MERLTSPSCRGGQAESRDILSRGKGEEGLEINDLITMVDNTPSELFERVHLLIFVSTQVPVLTTHETITVVPIASLVRRLLFPFARRVQTRQSHNLARERPRAADVAAYALRPLHPSTRLHLQR